MCLHIHGRIHAHGTMDKVALSDRFSFCAECKNCKMAFFSSMATTLGAH